MRQRDYFLKKARKTNHSEDWARYRCFRNRVTSRRRKRLTIDVLLMSGGDPRTFWKTMTKILPGEKKATSPNMSVNGSVTSDKRCIANAFNKVFASAATRLMSLLKFSGVPTLRQPSAFTHQNPPFKFEAVSVAFVRAQLCRLKAGKAVGLDNIPARLLKDAADTVAKPLTIIINASLQSGRVPDDWKAA